MRSRAKVDGLRREDRSDKNITNIAPDNAEFFENLVPEGALDDENLLWLGAVAADGTACAVLGAGIYDELAYIEWIYTAPFYRREGAARDLLKWLKTLLRRTDAKMLEISFSDEDENLEEFLEDERFFLEEDRDIYSVPVKDLIYSEMAEQSFEEEKTGAHVVTLEEFGKPEALYDYLARSGIPFSIEADDLDLSLIRTDKASQIDGCLLISRREDGDLEISYLLSEGLASGAVDLFLAFKDMATVKGWQEDNIIFTDQSGEIIRIIETITGTDRDSYILRGKKVGLISL